jgi:6-phospho-beta-glucosidase
MNEFGYKICVIGAGSTYTPELVEGIIDRAGTLSVRELAFVDFDADRLRILAEFARRMLRAAGLDVLVSATESRREGIEGAEFVLNQIRVGGQQARIRDEYTGRAHDVVGQETTGSGGFAKALRTIPVVLDIAADVQELSPDAWMINFTNPAGMVTEALMRYGGVKVMGLCNSPYGLQAQIARSLGVTESRVRLGIVGLNHLSWVRAVFLDGIDVIDTVVEQVVRVGRVQGDQFDADLIEALHMIPSSYLRYFYHQDDVLRQQRDGGQSRGEEVWAIERQLLDLYRDESLCCKPPLLEKRGGAHYSTVAVSLVSAIAGDTGEVHVVDCRNNGALADLPEDVAVEIPATINRQGAHAIAAGHVPFSIRGLMQHVKAYEELTIEAAVSGDERDALLALTANPLVPSFDRARALWSDIKRQNAPYLQRFPGSFVRAGGE